MLKAVFFDLDDTVLMPLDYNPWAEFKRRHDLPLDQLILDGVQTRPEVEREQIVADLQQYERDLAAKSRLRPGIRELMGDLERREVHTALLTNNHRQAVDFVVQTHQLKFPLVLTREDAKPKPQPDLLLKALEHFQLASREAVYIGDSQGDLDAAQAAGMEVLFLATPHNLSCAPRFEYPRELLEALLQRL